jgi:hypothetical protein
MEKKSMPNDAITPFTLILNRGPLRRLGGASAARQGDSNCFAEVR